MDGTCYIASLKCSPTMWTIGRGVGEPIRDSGHAVRYLLSSGYGWMCRGSDLPVDLVTMVDSSNPLISLIEFVRAGAVARLREIFREHPPSTLVFMNLNPFVDRLTIRIARKANPGVRIVSFLHEPYTTDKLVYGFKRAGLLHVYEYLSRGMASLSDAVILPSENAGEVFDRFYSRFRGDARIIPLPYADEKCEEALERRYVSFVGHIGNAHQKGLDLFFEMVEENARGSGDIAFQLVTGENPESALASLSPVARKSLRVVHEGELTDQVISRAIRQSLAVVLLQRRVMQSGVLPVAYMNGTPVIASELEGFTEFVDPGKTGCILPVDPTLAQRFDAIARIRAQIDEMAPLCRRAYEERFGHAQVTPHVPFMLGLRDSD